MIYSRKQISKAGHFLINESDSEKKDEVLTIINEWRANHLYPLNVMKNKLSRQLKDNKIDAKIISQRLKRLSSIELKLKLNDSMGLGGMQDIGGYRAVLKGTSDLEKLKKILTTSQSKHKLKKINDYVANPKPSGYRSIHFIYSYHSTKEKYKNLHLELQIRTKLQHNWATAVETASLMTSQALKSSQGSGDWLNFFKIVSSLFAIKEGMPVMDEHINLNISELTNKCKELLNSLNVLGILKALRVSAKKIETDKFKGAYYLIFINLEEKRVHIKTFKKSDLEIATSEYLNLEKKINELKGAVVLVEAQSIRSLKKAYPSYFLDTSQFIYALEKINSSN